jgi:hypothetical protein
MPRDCQWISSGGPHHNGGLLYRFPCAPRFTVEGDVRSRWNRLVHVAVLRVSYNSDYLHSGKIVFTLRLLKPLAKCRLVRNGPLDLGNDTGGAITHHSTFAGRAAQGFY